MAIRSRDQRRAQKICPPAIAAGIALNHSAIGGSAQAMALMLEVAAGQIGLRAGRACTSGFSGRHGR